MLVQVLHLQEMKIHYLPSATVNIIIHSVNPLLAIHFCLVAQWPPFSWPEFLARSTNCQCMLWFGIELCIPGNKFLTHKFFHSGLILTWVEIKTRSTIHAYLSISLSILPCVCDGCETSVHLIFQLSRWLKLLSHPGIPGPANMHLIFFTFILQFLLPISTFDSMQSEGL